MKHGRPLAARGDRPEFLEALLTVLKDEGYQNLTVADTCGPWGPTPRVIRKMGYDTSCDVTKTLLKTWEEEKMDEHPQRQG